VIEAVSLSLSWQPLGRLALDEMGRLVFPIAPSVSGVHRFEVDGDMSSVYFGEAADLRLRFRQYSSDAPSVGASPAVARRRLQVRSTSVRAGPEAVTG
jgi:hypothetical protein